MQDEHGLSLSQVKNIINAFACVEAVQNIDSPAQNQMVVYDTAGFHSVKGNHHGTGEYE